MSRSHAAREDNVPPAADGEKQAMLGRKRRRPISGTAWATAGLAVFVILYGLLVANKLTELKSARDGHTPYDADRALPSRPVPLPLIAEDGNEAARNPGVKPTSALGRQPARNEGGGSDAAGAMMSIGLSFTPAMDKAWATFAGEKGAVFKGEPTTLTLYSAPGGASALASEATLATQKQAHLAFWGKSSAKLRLTKRRSLRVTLAKEESEGIAVRAGGRPMTDFLLMSLWEDEYRLAYASAAKFLEHSGLWEAETRLVEVHRKHASPSSADESDIKRESFGVYLLIEFPSAAIARGLKEATLGLDPSSPYATCLSQSFNTHVSPRPPQQDIDVGVRVWKYHPKPAYYDIISFPSFAPGGAMSKDYRAMSSALAKDQSPDRIDDVVYLEQYLLWLAANSLLQNGDYDDEVFFARGQTGSAQMVVHAWDFDNVFSPCHKDGKFAVKQAPLFYCAESDLDKAVATAKPLSEKYARSLSCLLSTWGTPDRWSNAVSEAYAELTALLDNPRLREPSSRALSRASYEGKKVPDFSEGRQLLLAGFSARHDELSGLLKAKGVVAGGPPPPRRGKAAGGAGGVPETAGAACRGKDAGGKLKKEYNKEASVEAPASSTAVVVFDTDPREAPLAPGERPAFAAGGAYCFLPCGETFVIRDKQRGSAEWAVAPYHRPSDLHAPVTTGPPGAPGVFLAAPAVLPDGYPEHPVILRAAPRPAGQAAGGGARRSGAFWSTLDTRQPGTSKRRSTFDSTVVALSGANGNIDLAYGVGAVYSVEGPPAQTPYKAAVTLPSFRSAVLASSLPGFEQTLRDTTKRVPKTQEPTDLAEELRGNPAGNVVLSTGTVYIVRGRVVIKKGVTLSIPAGVTVLHAPEAVYRVQGTLRAKGKADASEDALVSFLPEKRQEWWGGFVVGSGGSLVLAHCIVANTGGTRHERVKGTGSHRKEVPAVSVDGDGSFTAAFSYFLELNGPGFGAGEGAVVEIRSSLIQGALQGGECRICEFTSEDSAVIDIPNRKEPGEAHGGSHPHNPPYIDGDNDGLYLSGGKHVVSGSVIAFTADDGIDTGTPSTVKKHGGSLDVEDTVIDGCQHEGLAISGVDRSIKVRNSIFRRCQQGVEMGYSAPNTKGVVDRVLFENNAVAVRYGDNYMKLSEGNLAVSRCVFAKSRTLDVVNLVRKTFAPSKAFSVRSSVFENLPVRFDACGLSNFQAPNPDQQNHRVSNILLSPDGMLTSTAPDIPDGSFGLERPV
ncbi:hypothetical protein DIPPA_18807 [Diplonema papillatum]|nr:hypothetical protein DIPPA_18807 [Diplonema papillatum]